MIIGLVCTVLGIIGVFGFFFDNSILVIIAAVAAIIETIIGLYTGELRSLSTTFLSVLAGVIYASTVNIPIWYGIAVGLSFESAIMGIIGWVVFVSAYLKINRKDSNSNKERSKRMKQYYSRFETPLKFHYFFFYIYIPFGILSLFGNLIKLYNNLYVFTWLHAIDTVYFISAILLLVICFVGFLKWASFSWKSLMAYLILQFTYNFYILLIYAIYLPDEIYTGLGQLIGISLFAFSIRVYYKKRRDLFLSTIKSANKKPDKTNDVIAEDENSHDIAYELKKYKALMDEGLITSDDFEAKKKQILGI